MAFLHEVPYSQVKMAPDSPVEHGRTAPTEAAWISRLSGTPEMGPPSLAGGAIRPRLPLDTGLDGRDSRSDPYPSAHSSESRGPGLRFPKTRTSLDAPKPRLA